MAKKSAGIAGSAVLLGTAGLYLIYAGVKDVPLVDGLRALLRKENPAPGSKTPYTPSAAYSLGGGAFNLGEAFLQGDASTLGLVGNALRAYKQFRPMFPNMTMHGRGERPDTPSSDHPHGKAIDLMTTDNATAQRIITVFRSQVGAKYWIWNRRRASLTKLWINEPYTGKNPHTDHVHLSYY